MSKKQSMIPPDEKVEMKIENPAGAPKHKVSKVNMILPTGKHLEKGKTVVLSEDDMKHLSKHFPDSLHHILE